MSNNYKYSFIEAQNDLVNKDLELLEADNINSAVKGGNALKHEEYLQRLYDIHGDKLKCLGKYINTKTKILHKCMKAECGFEWDVSPDSILQGYGCPVCKNKRVSIGINDMWTINPKLAALLSNPEDGYKYTQGSNKRVDWVCPLCHTFISNKVINHVRIYGLSCPSCSDGISYANKFFFNILSDLNIEFEYEKSFNWCSFYLNNVLKKGRYDFVFTIDTINYIVELDGYYHNNPHEKGILTLDDSIFIDSEKDRLAFENGYIIIRIACDYSKEKIPFELIKNNLINSDLNNVLNLSSVDWDDCNRRSQNSRLVECCELWNKGMLIKDIAIFFKLDRSTITKYIKIGNNIGLCPTYSYGKTKCICLTTGEIFESMTDAGNIYGVSGRNIADCCNNDKRNFGGVHPDTNEPLVWMKYADYLLLTDDEVMNKIENSKINHLYGHSAKPVVCITTSIIFPSIKRAADYYGIREQGIYACCNSKYKSSGKLFNTKEPLVWEYYNQDKHNNMIVFEERNENYAS